MGKFIADRDMKLGICVHLLLSLLMFAFSRVSDSPSEGKQGDGLDLDLDYINYPSSGGCCSIGPSIGVLYKRGVLPGQ